MTVREYLRKALEQRGSEALVSKDMIEKALELLGPEPSVDREPDRVTTLGQFYRRYGVCMDFWHNLNSASYHIYPECPSCREVHPEPWKLQKIPSDGTRG